MEKVLFWAKNDTEAEQIATNDFVTKACLVLKTYKGILETWVEHTPHTCFYSYYNSMFTGDDLHWLDKEVGWKKTISSTIDQIYNKVEFAITKEHIKKMMGGGEYPFIFLERMEGEADNGCSRYQYHISR